MSSGRRSVLRHRKTAPRVAGGHVLRKNNHVRTPGIFDLGGRDGAAAPALVRYRPGPGYRHLLLLDEIARFVPMIPRWREHSVGLGAIVLAAGTGGLEGWYQEGVAAVCGWPRELWTEIPLPFFELNRDHLNRLGVPWRKLESGRVRCEWTEPQIHAYQLTVVLTHELGHHVDRMTNRSRTIARGEPYAEAFSRTETETIWRRYCDEFGMP